jgi:hypothetical protein
MKRLLYLTTLFLAACDDGREQAQAICALVDTSGTYRDQIQDAATVLRTAVLPRMRPGDSLVVVRIDDNSYEKQNVDLALTLDSRPLRASQQKAEVAEAIATIGDRAGRPRHTDISGGMMLCAEYLAEMRAGKKIMIAFSDMKEELPQGVARRFEDDELKDLRVLAMNVKRLKGDSAQPQQYRARLAEWEQVVKSKGAPEWHVVIEPERLVSYLDGLRR